MCDASSYNCFQPRHFSVATHICRHDPMANVAYKSKNFIIMSGVYVVHDNTASSGDTCSLFLVSKSGITRFLGKIAWGCQTSCMGCKIK